MDREKIIIRTSLIGIIVNVMLSLFKAIVGFVSGSLAIVLDAVNNLSDAFSSVVTIIGTKLAGIGIYSFDEKNDDLREMILNKVRRHDGVLQIHAFYADKENKKLRFDVVLDYELENRRERFEEIKNDVCELLPDWDVNISLDIDV